MLKNALIYYALGTVATIIITIIAIGFNVTGLFSLMGVNLPEPQMPAALYHRLFWGGLLGMQFVVPFIQKLDWKKQALVAAIIPLAIQFLYVFPKINLGISAAIVFALINIGWSFVTAKLGTKFID